jgi:hypothetical protein
VVGLVMELQRGNECYEDIGSGLEPVNDII